ncbi:MAG: beta-ketoacyl-[acyl-carrier-protein] synthase family protein [Xanthomonadales bacterium]|nr:beta-ketoacyl-[acyl-carrier-protein] synthase family protein [Xanthomonadales bacterium]
MKRRVAITGLGAVCPLGLDVEQVLASLRAASSGIVAMECATLGATFPAGRVQADYATAFPKLEQPFLDRCQAMAIVAARQAIAEAGLDGFADFGARAGLHYGNVNGGVATIHQWHEDMLLHGKRKARPFTAMAIMSNGGGAQVAIRHAIRGPVLTHASACASSTIAIGEAMRAIADGRLDIAVAGGAEAPLEAPLFGVFDGTRAMSPVDDADPARSCKPFSRDRSGLVLGEGAAFLVLEAEDHARARGAVIHGYLVGYGVACDAHHIGMPASDGQVRCLRAALDDAGLAPAQVDYVNAHATATDGGDAIEAASLREVFGTGMDAPAVSSTKSVHGHLLGAAGALECLVTVLAVREGLLPASAHLGTPDLRCDLNHVGERARQGRIGHALAFSCGFGGTNAALVIAHPDIPAR